MPFIGFPKHSKILDWPPTRRIWQVDFMTAQAEIGRCCHNHAAVINSVIDFAATPKQPWDACNTGTDKHQAGK
jgi:hypothetical protein